MHRDHGSGGAKRRATPGKSLGIALLPLTEDLLPLGPFWRLNWGELGQKGTLARLVARSQLQPPLNLITIRQPTGTYVESSPHEAGPKSITVPALLVAFWH